MNRFKQVLVAYQDINHLMGNRPSHAIKWLIEPNHLFFDGRPIVEILVGRGDSVLKKLKEFKGE